MFLDPVQYRSSLRSISETAIYTPKFACKTTKSIKKLSGKLARSSEKKHLTKRNLQPSIKLLKPIDGAIPIFLLEAKQAIRYFPPKLCDDGTGGTYFLKNKSGKFIAVFKPHNEDALSSLNPKRTDNDSPLHFRGILPGEGYLREVLAYQIDPEFFKVPETYLAEVCHCVFNDGSSNSTTSKCKIGSIQKFVNDSLSSEDLGSSQFPIDDVHKIALLDILLVNCDRNAGNVLVNQKANQLIPIDHSFSLPDYYHLTDLQWFEWMNYRQSKLPISKQINSFIKNLSIQNIAIKAHNLKIRPECVFTLRLSHCFLLHALAANKTLFDIGKLMCSPNPNRPSVFAQLARQSQVGTSPSLVTLNNFSSLVSEYFRSN